MTTDPGHEHEHIDGQLIAKAWLDEEFRRRLLADPAAAVADLGFTLSPGVELRVVEDSEAVHHLVLPPRPAEGELSEEQLDAMAGGGPQVCSCVKDPHCFSLGRGCHLRYA